MKPFNLNFIDVKEFREKGYLQELNRQFLHPLGLALSIEINEDGTENLGGIWDYREDPEGMRFGSAIASSSKFKDNIEYITALQEEAFNKRMETLGYIYQEPIEIPE